MPEKLRNTAEQFKKGGFAKLNADVRKEVADRYGLRKDFTYRIIAKEKTRGVDKYIIYLAPVDIPEEDVKAFRPRMVLLFERDPRYRNVAFVPSDELEPVILN